MKRVLGLLLVLLLASLGVVSAAPAGRVNVLCSPNLVWCDAIKVEFPKATGIQLDYVRLSSGEAFARMRAEAANPSFDVWFAGTGDPHLEAVELGITEFYRPKSWNDLRPEFREAVGGKYIPLYKGLIAMPNPNTSGTGYTMLATIVQIYGEKAGFDLLKLIHRNIAQYTRGGADPGPLTGRGEIGIGVTFLHDAIDNILKGFPITYGSARDGTGFEIGGLSLVKGARNRDNAITFIEWALSPDGQRVAAELGQSYQIPSNSKTPVPRVAPRFQDFVMIKYDFLKYGKASVRDALIKKWSAEVFALPR